MSYDLIQTLIVAAIVVVAAALMARRLFPKTAEGVTRRLGFKAAAKTAAGCDSGCASCNGCKTLNFDLPPKS
ncbi:hypothetical protein [Asticcacaulis excentricus]|uniref:FeoB-associated Cys-rich membrane protein n=1 Tax=Asticcacaulis excentricus TaxID=78587 RepID=A0A3G9G8S0_9CAUL|nr:hypothetical protein [Asticcacaulis excentricus]BBF80728.1 hypothetical protein EM6_1313 [Asticcacaulis excentricus]